MIDAVLDDDAVFVFGPLADLGESSRPCSAIGALRQLLLGYDLLTAGVLAALRTERAEGSRLLLLLQWMAWVIGLAGLPYRAIGVCPRIACSRSAEMKCVMLHSVGKNPGRKALTRTPDGTHSRARFCVRFLIPVLATE